MPITPKVGKPIKTLNIEFTLEEHKYELQDILDYLASAIKRGDLDSISRWKYNLDMSLDSYRNRL